MTVAAYENRVVDLSIYQGIKPTGDQMLTQALSTANHGGVVITGIHKLVQTFALRLLTIKGSMRYLPFEGCDFMAEAQLGLFQNPVDIFSSFSASLVDIEQSFRLDDSTSLPDDERYDSAELVGITLSGTSASVRVKVTSRAGTSRVFIEPLAIPNKGLI
jgi:hypothetical protein